VPLLVGIALAPTAAGENDNASGVATALRLAESHGGALEHFDVWVLLTGAQGAIAGGMRRFIRSHRKELDRASTVFLNLDAVGHGEVRFARREGVLLAARPHKQLLELCEDIADDAEDLEVEPVVLRSPTDSSAARSARYPAITICCREGSLPPADEVDVEAFDDAYAFAAELIERIDAEIGPELDPDRP
jgi:Zn-dependent M28 family amino/carboxypeptidase